MAARLDCQTSPIQEQSINIANGRELPSAAMYKNLRWLLQETSFSSDFLFLPLGNVDIVLGV